MSSLRTPPPSVRREQVNNDPLLDSGNSARTTPPQAGGGEYNFEPPSYPRPVSVMDQIELFTESFLINCRKKPVNMKDITPDLAGLQTLAEFNAWKHILTLSSTLLSEDENILNSYTVWHLRFESLFRLKMYDELATEVGTLLSNEESKEESLINHNLVYSMRLLVYEIKVMTGRNQDALDQLHLMRVKLQQEHPTTAEKNADLTATHDSTNTFSARFWLLQIGSHIVNAAVRLRNWRIAVNELRRMVCEIKADIAVTTDADRLLSLKRSLVMVFLRLSRVLLQIGAIKDSGVYFERASQMCTADPTISQDCNIESHLLLNQGLVLMCSNQSQQYAQALDIFMTVVDSERAHRKERNSFDTALVLDSSSATSLDSKTVAVNPCFVLFSERDESVLASAVNNAAICALYVKQITQAISYFESLVVEDPARYMTDPVIFNLCTLYDLSFAPDISTTKKKVLQKVASRFGVDDPVLHWRSFRLA